MQIDNAAYRKALTAFETSERDAFGQRATWQVQLRRAITAYLTALASQEGAEAGEVETLPPEIEEALELFGIEVYELGLKARVGDPDRAKRAAIYNRLTTAILAALTTPPAPDEAVLVAVEAEPCELDDCPEGLFLSESGHFGFMSEYATVVRNGTFRQRDAYVVESGEYFWGGTSDPVERAKLKVQPVTLIRARKGGGA